MKASSVSRRGVLMGPGTFAVSRLAAADETIGPITEEISIADALPRFHDVTRALAAGDQAASTPPYAYVGCYTGGANARGISVLHYDPTTNEMTLVGIVSPVSSPSFIVLDAS